MRRVVAVALLALTAVACVAAVDVGVASGDDDDDDTMPLPFTRVLILKSPVMQGPDVYMAQNLLIRSPYVNPDLRLNSVYDFETANAVAAFKAAHGRSNSVFDSTTAQLLLSLHLDDDDYVDDRQPLPAPYLYKVYIPVWRDRSIETTATLYDAQLRVLRQYTVRTHGQNDAQGRQLNQWTPNGITPTGLSTFDLNSPEDDPQAFGPYPVNRFVQGLKGNAAVVVSDIRDGLLQHTGEWPNWNASMPMPNSDGCVHGHPDDIDAVWQLLVSIGVEVRNNTNGALPYPYAPQGLVSVELQDP